ncbi:MAG: DNA primase [Patescibacteria group bacterium]
MSEIDEIKQRIDIVQLVGEYVQDLRQSGTNWKAKCPFHNEKTPSFLVSQEKQIYKCFGCGSGGDIFTFIQEIEGMDFPEALRLLAKKAGVSLKQEDPRIHSQKTRLLDIQRWAAAYWYKVLEESSRAAAAREYIIRRGISKETAIDFKLGYAPDSWDRTMNFLKSKGYTETEISLAGLIKRKERGSGYYDRFRNRIIFPIGDVHGSIIAFGGRAMDEQSGAKYLNSPQTPIYDKSFTVYGLDKARQEIKSKDLAIFVEGYMDVISSHQAGVKNVVATSGTALTTGHLKLIKRYTNNVAFCFDQDLAGQLAAQRSIDIALAEDINIKIIQVAHGKDPDECVRKDPNLWLQSIGNAKPYMEYYLEVVMKKHDIADINQKKKAAKTILTQLSKIPSKIEQDFWMKKISESFAVGERILWESMPKPKSPLVTASPSASPPAKSQFTIFDRLFGLILANSENMAYFVENLEKEMVKDTRWREFYSNLISLYNENNNLSGTNFEQWLKKQETASFSDGFFNNLILVIQREFDGFSHTDIQNELVSLIKKIKKDYFRGRVNELSTEMKRLEASGQSDERIDQLMQEIQEVSWQLARLE